jgi:acetolactate synthase-1/2/3 large subunit
MKAAQLFIECLENEGVHLIFGIPGEENLDIMEALRDSRQIHFITTRHEQAAAFMADVYGRLTGKTGVCLATLGPGATNLVTGFADANMDRAPIVALAGQGATTRMHKESHQVLDLVNLFAPIAKYSVEIREPEIIPEVVRKAFKNAAAEKPGGSFISFPENIAQADIDGKAPLKVQSPTLPIPPQNKILQAAEVISQARFPILMAGNGVIRAKAAQALVAFAEQLNIPVATTFMAKGVIPSSHPLSLGTVGLQAHDYVACGFDRADMVICVGYDMVEYHPHLWHSDKNKKIIHVDMSAAEVDEHYVLECGVVGDISAGLESIACAAKPHDGQHATVLRETIAEAFKAYATDLSFPVKPQKIIWDLRQVLAPEDIVVCDVGAHKLWMARMYQAEQPNTCIISNGFAAMGIGVPGAIAAKLAYPDRVSLTVTGDGGFLMNSQEIETALRIGAPIIILVWNDSGYGVIQWHQQRRFGHDAFIRFNNPDLVAYAESFGAKGYRVQKTEELLPTLKQAIADNTVVLIDCPVDYSENMKLTEQLGKLVCPT